METKLNSNELEERTDDIFRMDKTVLEHGYMDDDDSDVKYWLSRTPKERMQAMEYLRRQMYGEDYDRDGIQRVIEYIQLP